MKNGAIIFLNAMRRLAILLFLIFLVVLFACENDDSKSENDDDADDDAADDDVSDDDFDDDLLPDDYVAPWPQSNVEEFDYDESPEPGPLRLKAQDYDQWCMEHHQPFYGSIIEILYKDDAHTEVEKYHGSWDSCFWTGEYLASQAFRYYVTREPQAKANVIKSVHALDGHLHVTGLSGYIARYRGPQDPLVLWEDCETNPDCHLVFKGEYAGDFWVGDTSRDQYNGWLLGMSLAYDLVDDEDMRKIIRDDVTEVLDYLIANKWRIKHFEAEPDATPAIVLPNMQLLWSLIAYHITGEERFKAVVKKWITNSQRDALWVSGISIFSRYMEYYGNHLAHQTFYNLLRLGKVYLSEDDYEFLKWLFENQTHLWVKLSHNPFFSLVYMSQGDYAPYPDNDEYQLQLEQDLTDFWPAPSYQRWVEPPLSEVDPISVWLDELVKSIPWLEEQIGSKIEPQAKEAYPIQYQCPTHLYWENSPFRIVCDQPENWLYVYPGFDYLIAYWMASYHKFLKKEQ